VSRAHVPPPPAVPARRRLTLSLFGVVAVVAFAALGWFAAHSARVAPQPVSQPGPPPVAAVNKTEPDLVARNKTDTPVPSATTKEAADRRKESEKVPAPKSVDLKPSVVGASSISETGIVGCWLY